MCDELMNGSLPLLIPTPNGRDEAGTSRDCFLLNPQANSVHHVNMFTFLGKTMLNLVSDEYLLKNTKLTELGCLSLHTLYLVLIDFASKW